jgi:hypothetical protein
MDSTLPSSPRKLRSDTKAKLAEALRLIADALELDEAKASPAAPLDTDAPCTAEELQKTYPVTIGWLKGHVSAVGRGPRQRLLFRPSDVRRALEANPPKPATKKCAPCHGLDPLEALIASGAVVRGDR